MSLVFLEAARDLTDADLMAFVDTLDDDERDLLAGEAAPDLGEGVRFVSLREHMLEVDPGPHNDYWHVGAIAEQCQRVLDGEIRRLLLTAPRRYGKSRQVAQNLPSCALRNHIAKYPPIQGGEDFSYFVGLMFASDKWARFHSDHARKKLAKAGIVLRVDTNDKSLWMVRGRHVGMWTTTTNGSQLGAGARLLIVDDPIGSYEDAARRSVQERALAAIDSFSESADLGEPKASLVVMHQRLNVRDPVGRLLERELDEKKAQGWAILDLPAEARKRRTHYPITCEVIADPRPIGAPLCPELESIEEIRKRRAANPTRAAAMDDQEPVEGKGGGLFRSSWLPIIGGKREDLGTPVEALEAMADAGLIQPIRSLHGGHDFAAGGADAVAFCGLARLAPGAGPDVILFDPREDHVAAAAVKGTAISNADRHGTTVRQAIPKETAVGAAFTADLEIALKRLGFGVDVLKVGKGKYALAQPLASHAAPSCRKCGRTVVEPEERDNEKPGTVCECNDPDVEAGKVAILDGPGAQRLREVLHDFTGEEGGEDDLVDAAAIGYNASMLRVVRGIGQPMVAGGGRKPDP